MASASGERQQTMEQFLAKDAEKATSNTPDADQDVDQEQSMDKAMELHKKKSAAEAEEPKDVSNKEQQKKRDVSETGTDVEATTGASGAEPKHVNKKPKVEPTKKSAGDTHSENLPENTLEQGRVFFMYKPRVVSAGDQPHVSGLGDIQRTYLLLQPQQPSSHKSRLLVLPKKRLPDPGRHERFFAFVEAVAESPSDLTSGLTDDHYETKTRGERVQPAARAVAEGHYVIAKGGQRNGVHWAYKLEVPQEPGEAQKVLGIMMEGSYALSAKNPDKQGPYGAPTAGPRPEYTSEQQEQFQGRSWIGVEDTSLLDVSGTELLLVGTKADPIETGELGDAGELLQQLGDEEEEKLQQPEQQEEVLKALEPTDTAGNNKGDKGREEAIPVEPAVTGKLI